MTYLTPKIDTQLENLISELTAAHQAWHRWLTTADRDHLVVAEQQLEGLGGRLDVVRDDIRLEHDITAEGGSP